MRRITTSCRFAQAASGAPTIVADVVGPVCESGDYLALDRTLPEPKAGDLLAIMTAGAYGAVQSGTYNTRALVPEVLVKDDQYAVVRPRIEVEALIAMDRAGAVAVNVFVVPAKAANPYTDAVDVPAVAPASQSAPVVMDRRLTWPGRRV